MTLQGTWSIIVAHSVLLIPYWKPSLLKPPCLNCCYIGVQLYIAFWISPWNATFDDMFVLELLGFALGSVPAAVMATNALVLLLGWFPVCGVVLLRVSTETDFAVAQPDTVVNPRTLIFINILFTGWLLKIGFTRFWFPPKTLGGSMNVLPCFFFGFESLIHRRIVRGLQAFHQVVAKLGGVCHPGKWQQQPPECCVIIASAHLWCCFSAISIESIWELAVLRKIPDLQIWDSKILICKQFFTNAGMSQLEFSLL